MATVMTAAEKKEAMARAVSWVKFREANKLSQRFLAEIIGISRRTIQGIEAGILAHPHPSTLKAFADLREKYLAEGRSDGSKHS